MTQLLKARDKIVTPEMVEAARFEGLDPDQIMASVAKGSVVIPKNKGRSFSALGIGEGLSTKVNANIGTSPRRTDTAEEMEKLKVAVDAGFLLCKRKDFRHLPSQNPLNARWVPV